MPLSSSTTAEPCPSVAPLWPSERLRRFVHEHEPRGFELSVKLTRGTNHARRVNAWYGTKSPAFVQAALDCFAEVDANWLGSGAIERLREHVAALPVQNAKAVVLGWDLRAKSEQSRLKIAFSFVHSPTAVSVATTQHPVPPVLEAAVLPHRLLFGFAVCGRGRIHHKLYPSFHIAGDDRSRFEAFAERFLSDRSAVLARQCARLHVTCESEDRGGSLVLHFRPRSIDDFVAKLDGGELGLQRAIAMARRGGATPKVVSARESDLRQGPVHESNLYSFLTNQPPVL